MKKIILLVVFGSLSFAAMSQIAKTKTISEPWIITNSIVNTLYFGSQEFNSQNDSVFITENTRENLIQGFSNPATVQKVRIYEPKPAFFTNYAAKENSWSDQVIPIVKVDSLFSSVEVMRIIKPEPPYDEYETTMIKKIEVDAINFEEAWVVDTTRFRFVKAVRQQTACNVAIDEKGNPFLNPLYCMKPQQNERPALSIIGSDIMYDVQIKNDNYGSAELWNVNRLEVPSRYALIFFLLQKTYQGKIPAYENINSAPLSPERVRSLLNPGLHYQFTSVDPPYDTFDTIIYNPVDIDHIEKIRFVEDWYLNPATLMISKKVKALCLMEGIVSDDSHADGSMKFRPLYWIKFKD